MIRVDLTLDDPVANIAFDEAMLEQAESDSVAVEVLRLWESPSPIVVLGRSSPFQREVNLDYCREQRIPVIRRSSGGQTVVAGPGCLMYALLLNYHQRPELRMLDVAHQFVMGQMRDALNRIGVTTSINGTSDLTLDGRKVSGNSLRCKRNWMVYHGTMICQMDLDLIASCLDRPIREPDYRQNRGHRDFLCQLPTDTQTLRDAIATQWQAQPAEFAIPQAKLQELMETRYLTREWNQKV